MRQNVILVFFFTLDLFNQIGKFESWMENQCHDQKKKPVVSAFI